MTDIKSFARRLRVGFMLSSRQRHPQSSLSPSIRHVFCFFDARVLLSESFASSLLLGRRMIESDCGICAEAQCLRDASNRDLKDEDKLRDIMVTTRILDLIDLSDDRFTIMLKTLTAKNIGFEVGVIDSVEKLKTKIQEREGIPSALVRIIFNSTQLRDDKMFGLCGVTIGSVVHMVLRLRGCDCGCGLEKFYLEGDVKFDTRSRAVKKRALRVQSS